MDRHTKERFVSIQTFLLGSRMKGTCVRSDLHQNDRQPEMIETYQLFFASMCHLFSGNWFADFSRIWWQENRNCAWLATSWNFGSNSLKNSISRQLVVNRYIWFFQDQLYLFLWKRGDRYHASKLLHQNMVQPVKVLVPETFRYTSDIFNTLYSTCIYCCLPSQNLNVTVAWRNLNIWKRLALWLNRWN